MQGYHRSVLLKEAIDALMPTRQGQDGLTLADNWYLDLTLGDGGYSLEILKRGGKVVGIDVDPGALERAKGRLGEYGRLGRFVAIQGNFRDIKNLTAQTVLKDPKFAGAIFDLGVSGLQLETPARGFSFGKSGPLDMRMDPSLNIRAWDLINHLSRKELYELFSKMGEEKYSWALAGAVVRAREVKPLVTTKELAEVVIGVFGGVRGKIHPATRVFQALRIAVNDELGALEEGLKEVRDLIRNDGRVVVVSFHSLEDRIVKNTFRQWEEAGVGEILTKKPLVPGEAEVMENPRSRSAKMRVFRVCQM